MLRQYLYFCTCTASKVSTCWTQACWAREEEEEKEEEAREEEEEKEEEPTAEEVEPRSSA